MFCKGTRGGRGGCLGALWRPKGYGGGGLSGMSEFVEGEEVVERTLRGDWLVVRDTGESERGVDIVSEGARLYRS